MRLEMSAASPHLNLRKIPITLNIPRPGLSGLLSYNLNMRDTDHLLQSGSTNGYRWLVSTDRRLDVLECCPDVVLGKYVAITSFDSGPLGLTEAQRSAGWVSQEEIAYSPQIQDADIVPQAYFSAIQQTYAYLQTPTRTYLSLRCDRASACFRQLRFRFS